MQPLAKDSALDRSNGNPPGTQHSLPKLFILSRVWDLSRVRKKPQATTNGRDRSANTFYTGSFG